MATNDFAELVATMSFPIVAGIGLRDAPKDQQAMLDAVAAWIAAGGAPVRRPADDQTEGMGFGLELLPWSDLAHVVIEAILGASMSLGLQETFDSVRHWRRVRVAQVPKLRVLTANREVLLLQMKQPLSALGVDEDQADELARAALAALPDEAASPPPGMDSTTPSPGTESATSPPEATFSPED